MAAQAQRQAYSVLANSIPDAGRSDCAALDLMHLERQCMGDAALAGELLELFRAQAAAICAKMAQARGLPAAVADDAHKLKGSAAAVGATGVAEAAGRLEAACRAGLGAEDRDAALAALGPAVEAAAAAIQNHLKAP